MATTINNYSIGLGLDASAYIRGGQLSRQETAKIVTQINAARTPMENFGRQYDLLEKALQRGAIDLNTYSRLLEVQRQKLAAAEAATRKLTDAQNGLNQGTETGSMATGKMITSLRGYAVGFFGVTAAINAVKGAIGAAFSNERALVSLEVLLGSASDAQEKLKQLKEIDAKSPLTLEAGIQATRTLLSFGVTADRVIPIVKMLGDVTGADNERFKSMALAFAQVSAAGRLQGQDLRQMIDAGFNPLQEISRKTGESLAELKTRMEEGGIASLEVAQAFESATSSGGKFFGMMDRLGESASGKFGQMVSKLQQIGVELGTSLSPLVISLSQSVMTLAPALTPAVLAVGKFADGLAFALNLVMDLFDGITMLPMGRLDGFTFANVNAQLDKIKEQEDRAREMAKQDAELKKQTTAVLQRSQQLAAQSQAEAAAKRAEALRNEQNALKLKQEQTKEVQRQANIAGMDATRRMQADRQLLVSKAQRAALDRMGKGPELGKKDGAPESLEFKSAEAAKYILENRANAMQANMKQPPTLSEQQEQTRLLRQIAEKPTVQRKR